MAKIPESKKGLRSAYQPNVRSKDFFAVPAQKSVQSTQPDFRMRLGGVPLETRAGFELLSYRMRQLLRNEPQSWQEIERDEHGSFWTLFKKYHLPFLLPTYFFFVIRECIHFVKLSLFLRHVCIIFPIFIAIYIGYIFILGILAEETAEASGGRFSPQSGMRIAIFASLTLSFFSLGLLLPVVKIPIVLLGIYWHYQQLFAGARTLLNISEAQFTSYKLSHLVVWLLLGLTIFFVISVVSFIAAKLGMAAI